MRRSYLQPKPLARAAACLTLLLGCGDGGPRAPGEAPELNIPAPPSLAGYDRALQAACREAAAGIRDRPAEAQSWVHLGMVYGAHAMHDYARPCFEQAMVLDAGVWRAAVYSTARSVAASQISAELWFDSRNVLERLLRVY